MAINKNMNNTTKNETTGKGDVVMVSVEMKMREIIEVAKKVGVAYRVGMTKAELMEAVNVVLAQQTVLTKENTPAVDESTAAEEIQKKEEIKVEEVQRKNQKALDRWAKKTEGVIMKTSSNSKYINQARESLYEEILDKAQKYVEGLGELPIHVAGIRWNLNAHNELVPMGTNKNKYGWMHVVVGAGVLQYHVYNHKERKFEWRDFSNYDLDAAGINADGSMRNRSRIDIFRPITGSGNLVLPIYHSEALGGFFVMLPNVVSKDGTFRPIFKTADYRWGTFSANNNGRVNAALSAYLRMTQSQFIQDNPLNRHGFSESCMNCQHLVGLGVRDGVTDDIHMDAKSNVILNQLTVEELARNGQYQPQRYCTIFRKLVDAEAVTELNEALAIERQAVEVEEITENGEVITAYRHPGAGQVIISGKITNVHDVISANLEEICKHCPFYHKVERKSQERINAEIVAAREAAGDHRAETFVSKYFTEAPKIERQVVQTKVNGTWVTAFPGDAEGAEDFRIKGLGGIMVYTHPQWAEANKELGALEYVAPMYEYDEKKAKFERKLERLFYAARNLAKLTEEQAREVFTLAMTKPQDLSQYDEKRWERAVEWLRQAVIWAQERSAKRKPFAQKFFVAEDGVAEEVVIVHADDIMSETRFREEAGAFEANVYLNSFAASEQLSFRSLTDKEFVPYLDESTALDLVYYVLTTGQPVYITGEVRKLKEGERQDAELVAGALQHMLDAHVGSFLYGVRRAVNPKETLDALKVCDEVKAYIASYIKL